MDGTGSQDVLKNLENVIGTKFSDRLGGNNADNLISGLDGNDFLVGRGGNDTLVGGLGQDAYDFNNPNEGLDTILDFTPVDQLRISSLGFAGGLTEGILAPEKFVLGSSASNSSHRFIYDTLTGNIFFDSDGDGAAAQKHFLTLAGAPTFAATNFFVAPAPPVS
jgi:Ca2+-binding RTX toxin-like protein